MTEPFLVIFLGFGLVNLAYFVLKKHRKKTKAVIEEKKKIDTILNKYQIKYSCNIEFEKKNFTNQYVTVELKTNSNLFKDSKITFQI